jgi:hypothetical protein
MKNPSSQSMTNSASSSRAGRLVPGTPVGGARSSRQYNVSSYDGTASEPVTPHQASAKAIAFERVPRTAGSPVQTVDTSTAAVFAMAGGSPLTSSASPDVCSAAPTAPSQSTTDSKTSWPARRIARRAVSSLVYSTGSRR